MLIICAVIQKLKYTESCLNTSLRKCIYKQVGNACNCENIQLNPLMPVLNPAEQCSLPRYFTGDFKFYCLIVHYIILAAAEGLWHLGSLFYHDIHYSQRGWYITNLILCDILQNKAPGTGPCHIWCTHTLCPFFGREKNTDGSTVGLISLASVCYGDFCWGLLLLLLFLFFFFLKIVF